MKIKDSSTCESPPDALKQRTEALARHIGEAMEGGSGFVFGVLYDENHCADIGGINGVNKEVVARLRSSFTRMFNAAMSMTRWKQLTGVDWQGRWGRLFVKPRLLPLTP